MDGVQITFIANDKLVLSLKNGELYVLTLCADSMRSVRNFHFDKAAASVLTCCVSFIWFNLMNFIVKLFFFRFVSSKKNIYFLDHFGFTEKDENTVITIDDQETEKEPL